MVKPFQTTKEINGKKYTAQFNGVGAALNGEDAWNEGNGKLSNRKMADYLLKNVIVEPKGLTPDDFDTVSDLDAVVTFALSVMNGYFRPGTSSAKAEAKG